MCGISGIIGRLTPDDIQKCETMSNRLRHRGPDDAGSWSWNVGGDFGAILNHRRLSIIDLRHIAAEPMISEATGTALIFNGEIYNFRSLREELQQAGARFVTNGDTEVILHGYDLWGPEVVKRLRGMFAFMLVDPNKRRAVVARAVSGRAVRLRFRVRRRGAGGVWFCGPPDQRGAYREFPLERLCIWTADDLGRRRRSAARMLRGHRPANRSTAVSSLLGYWFKPEASGCNQPGRGRCGYRGNR